MERGEAAQERHFAAAKRLLQEGQAAPAADRFRQAIAAHDRGDRLASCYLGLGSALGELGRRAEALVAYRQVVKLRPEDPEAHRTLAMGFEELGQLEEARRSLERSLALDADQLSVYHEVAQLFLREKRVEEAKKLFLRYELRRTDLIRILGLSGEEAQREGAALALGEARDEATAKALGLALTDRSRAVRLAVIRSLGQLALAEGAGPLRERLRRSTDAEERRAIELSLQTITSAAQPGSQPAPAPAPTPGSAGATGSGKARQGR